MVTMGEKTLEQIRAALPTHIMLTPGVHIYRLLGVNQGSVSRFLSGKQTIPPRLEQIMQEVGVINNNCDEAYS